MDRIIQKLRSQYSVLLERLEEYLRFPSVSADPNHRQDMVRCADFTASLMQWAGLQEVTVHATGGHPIVLGEWHHAPGAPTVLIYGHYDVQPVDPLDLWEQDPFTPHQRDDRLIARGSADDKGQFFVYLAALHTIMGELGTFPVNVICLAEGEEEVGSAHLPEFLRNHRQRLQADIALVSDTAMWAEGWPAITVGLRGLIGMELQLTGPDRDLHSGTYGGGVANPLELMARLLASLKDEQGRVVIDGFYDKVRLPSPKDREELQRIPLDEPAYWQDLGASAGAGGERDKSLLERLWWRPTLEINGLWGGFNGVGSKTVLPSKAFAKITCRLVADQDPEEVASLVIHWLENHVPVGARLTIQRFPGSGVPLVVKDDLPALGAARLALKQSFGRDPLLLREGASIPITADFKEILGMDTLLLGFSLPDARCHSPNENIHLPTLLKGMEAIVRLLFQMGQPPTQK
ncbi:MAG: dipeptidase [Magnetococcales bacterium]|nr:dipeptidase [Magnetococcales bacterium]